MGKVEPASGSDTAVAVGVAVFVATTVAEVLGVVVDVPIVQVELWLFLVSLHLFSLPICTQA